MRTSLLALAAVATLAAGGAYAAPNPPQNGYPVNSDLGVQITNTLTGPGTVTATPVPNNNWRGVVCTAKQTAVSGSPSWAFSIQSFDAATATWNTLATSSTISTSTTNVYTVWVYPGMVAADVPTNGVAKGISLPKTWRLSQTITGSLTATTSKVGCNYLD